MPTGRYHIVFIFPGNIRRCFWNHEPFLRSYDNLNIGSTRWTEVTHPLMEEPDQRWVYAHYLRYIIYISIRDHGHGPTAEFKGFFFFTAITESANTIYAGIGFFTNASALRSAIGSQQQDWTWGRARFIYVKNKHGGFLALWQFRGTGSWSGFYHQRHWPRHVKADRLGKIKHCPRYGQRAIRQCFGKRTTQATWFYPPRHHLSSKRCPSHVKRSESNEWRCWPINQSLTLFPWPQACHRAFYSVLLIRISLSLTLFR